jgi:ATP-dependent helicase/DNAse subunit B
MTSHVIRTRQAASRPARSPDSPPLVEETRVPYPAVRPPLTLLLGAAGAGKTAWTLTRFLQSEGRALLVVSSPEQAATRAEQIAERLQRPAAEVRGAISSFRTLIAGILRSGEPDGFRPIDRTFQRIALADLFKTNIRADDFFGRMCEAPGFIPALAERLREWKLACITPDTLERGALAAADGWEDPAFLPKIRELARLFRAYETFLQQNRLRDEEDNLRLASRLIASHQVSVPSHADLVLVDGFYRFTRAQRELLAAFAGRGWETGSPECEVAVTLPYDAERPLLFAAPQRTLATLRAEFETHEEILTREEGRVNGVSQRAGPWGKREEDRPTPLRILGARIFAPLKAEGRDKGRGTGEWRQPEGRTLGEEGRDRREEVGGKREEGIRQTQEGSEEETETDFRLAGQEAKGEVSTMAASPSLPSSLLLFDAPNPYVEAEMVAREFCRLHGSRHCAWSDFAVILRGMGDYAPILAAVFERYGIPLSVDGPEILAENPLLKTLLHLLAVVRRGWQREDVLAFLKSSYTAPGKLAADALRRRARKAGVREGRERWLQLIREETGDAVVAQTLREMARFDAHLLAQRAAPEEFVDRIREIVSGFGLEERIALGEPIRAQRDRVALTEALDVLSALAQMARITLRSSLSFAEFHEELLDAWQSAASIASSEGDRVRVAEPYDARERPLKVAAVMGLTERVFPRRITEDPFLRDEERALLRQVAGLDLEAQMGRADDERFLFYLAITAPSETLILSFPRATDEADTLPSFYLDEVRAVFAPAMPTTSSASTESAETPSAPLQTISRTLADVAPRPEEVVSPQDRLLAACADLFDAGPEGASQSRTRRMRRAAALMQTCLEDSRMAEAVRTVVASRRLPHLPRLESADLRADFAGQDRVFSVTELETHARCPFQYLLRHALKLRPEDDGTHPGAQGTLLHAVLRRYFRHRTQAASPSPSSPESAPDLETMRAELRSLLADTLDRAPLDASPHRLHMTQRMLTDALDGFAERELRFGVQFGLTPAHFELAFGFGDADTPPPEDEERETVDLAESMDDLQPLLDPMSCMEPLILQARDGGAEVKVCGAIDRVDLDATGRRALALDYKLGRPPDYSEIQRGSSLQMPLYLLALERLFDKVGAVGCYDSMRERGRRRFHRTEHVNLRQFSPLMPLDDPSTVKPLSREQFADLTQTAEATAVRSARAIAQAGVEAIPGEHCRVCPYGDVCRTTLTTGHDGEAAHKNHRRPFEDKGTYPS